jgi:hypothetical protein
VMCSNEETQQMVKSLTPLETDPILLGSKYGWNAQGSDRWPLVFAEDVAYTDQRFDLFRAEPVE